MKYVLDITNSYTRFIDFEGLSGIKGYLTLPAFDFDFFECRLNFENLSINMDEDIWRNEILSINPKSIISTDNDLIILARKASLVIKDVRSYDFKVTQNNNNYYHSSGLAFYTKDRHIDFGGHDSEHFDDVIYGNVNFHGGVFLEFEEENIIPIMIGCDNQTGGYIGIKEINKDKEDEVISKNRKLDVNKFNGIESPIWNFDFLMGHFSHLDGYWEAIKNHG